IQPTPAPLLTGAAITRNAPSEMQAPTTKSLHRLSIENPRFAIHPLFWTEQHLDLVHCTFKQIERVIDVSAFSVGHGDDKFIEHATRLSKSTLPVVKSFSVEHLLCRQGSPLKRVRRSLAFNYAQQCVRLPGCELFQVATQDNNSQQVPLIIGYYHYNYITDERQKVLTPPSHHGCYNAPVSRLNQRKLRQVTPALWFQDPYLVCLLLSLAQYQWRSSHSWQPKAILVRLLVTHEEDATHAHVYQAKISCGILECLRTPSLSMTHRQLRPEFSTLKLQAGSSWGRDHLFAFHVISATPPNRRGYLLPALQPFSHDLYFEADKDIPIGNQRKLSGLLGSKPAGVRSAFEHHLVGKFGTSLGQFWAALEDVKAQEDDPDSDSLSDEGSADTGSVDFEDLGDAGFEDFGDNFPLSDSDHGPLAKRRKVKSTNHKDMVSSTHLQIGSSSSQQGPSSSQISYQSDFIEAHTSPRQEAYTVRLISCAIRHILHYSQHQEAQMVLELRQSERLALDIPSLEGSIVSIDDGGLRLRLLGKRRPGNNFVALLEAKRCLKVLDGRPVISDDCLAQMTCEAIVTKATQPSQFPDDR
ncbi:hypothetical protein KAF25_001917, partial [Fusarium avenaceum]